MFHPPEGSIFKYTNQKDSDYLSGVQTQILKYIT